MMLPEDMNEMFPNRGMRAAGQTFGPLPQVQPSTPVEQPDAMGRLRAGMGAFQRGAAAPRNFLQKEISRIPLFGPLHNIMQR